MRLPRARGPWSSGLVEALVTGSRPHRLTWQETWQDTVPFLLDDDAQLTLWMLYELHYRGFDGVEDREWDPDLIGLRRCLEQHFEQVVRAATEPSVVLVSQDGDLADQLLRFIAADDGPPTASYLQRRATREQVLDFLRERSVYHLKESDPHSFVLPRLDGPAKAALAELQYDEYGSGRPERLHATMYGDALAACGLDRAYGAYVDDVSALTLASSNLVSMFALQRRLRGAAVGHLAAFEATSAVPCRKIAAGIERVGLPAVAAAYFHEHVEADSVHEQVAARDICGALVDADPTLREDVLFGAAACLYVDALAGQELLSRWRLAVAA